MSDQDTQPPREDDRNDEVEGTPVPDPEEEQGDAEDVPDRGLADVNEKGVAHAQVDSGGDDVESDDGRADDDGPGGRDRS